MSVPAFEEREMVVVSKTPGDPLFPPLDIFDYPVTPREAFIGALEAEAVWEIVGHEKVTFTPRIIPDNVARALVIENSTFDPDTQGGGPDMFGIEWEYVPVAMGSMVHPGQPFLSNANEWYEKVVWPDIESWDWQGSAALNNGTYLLPEYFNCLMFQTGYFERLISMLDFEGALMALVDEEQHRAVKDFFEKLSDLYIAIFAKAVETWPRLDGFEVHDDWGSQQNTFFSPDIVAEFIVPSMRKVNDFVHSKGRYCLAHSCGNNIRQVENYIAAGYDAWNPQPINDTAAIYERFGDRLLIGVYDEPRPDATQDEQRQAAQAFANRFCRPGKPSYLNMYSAECLTAAYREELYRQSRINYSA
jgi:hypothetical protein